MSAFPRTIYVTKQPPPVHEGLFAIPEAGDEEFLSATGRLEYVDNPQTAVYALVSVGKVKVKEAHAFVRPPRRKKKVTRTTEGILGHSR